MSIWLYIIGVGEQGVVSLPAASRALIDDAEIVVGSDRILETLPDGDFETHPWTSPLLDMVETIKGWHGRKTIVLATGDPSYYGVGNTLVRQGIPLEETQVIPAPSAFSLACARLGWSQQDVETVSLHGRPVALISPLIQPRAKILALTSGAETIHAVADILVARGFETSQMTILEHMDGDKERMIRLRASEVDQRPFAPFNTLAVECFASAQATLLPRIAGLPDNAFKHDGQITKREVRAATLAALAPSPGALLWDVGAGCGSIAIEWCRAARRASAICFESDATRCAIIAENAVSLGVPDITIVEGEAPQILHDQIAPDAIFIGGGLSDPDLFEVCWNALRPGGRLVANVVTLEGVAVLMAVFRTFGGNMTRMAISRADALGDMAALKPLMPVTQWHAIKPMNGQHDD